MVESEHSGGGCCGGAKKPATNQAPQPPVQPGGGCGCGTKKLETATAHEDQPAQAGCCGDENAVGRGDHHGAHDQAPGATRADPVCGMQVDPATSKHQVQRDGETYFFCSEGCRRKFATDPSKYVGKSASDPHHHHAAPKATDSDAIYTCPMHPQIRQKGPGHCPICGMALEPLVATASTGPDPELTEMSRRFWFSLALTVPVFVLEMGGHFLDLGRLLSPTLSTWIQLTLSTPVVLWGGWPFFARGWASLRNRSFNMFTLIALGIGAAYSYSLVATLIPDIFPDALKMDGLVPVYFEAAAVITVLVLLGQVLELRARSQTGGAIRALLNLTPPRAVRLREDDSEEEIALDAVAVGNRLRIKPGGRVPVDGIVLEGTSAVDESMVTGESLPVEKEEGGRLIGGTVNGTGAL